VTLDRMPILILNPHNRCNCRCTMCDIWKNTAREELRAADIERQIESLERLSVEWVVLSGGEALMHSDLWQLTAILRVRKIRITLLSSGLLISRDAARIVDQVDDLIVSLDGPQPVHDSIRGVPGAFRCIEKGVRDLQREKPGFRVAARCTVQRNNFEHLCATAAAARGLDLQSISFLAADLTTTAFNRPGGWSLAKQSLVALPDQAAITKLEEEMEALIALRYGDFIVEPPAKLRRIVRHFRAHLGMEPPKAPHCNAPWTSAVVEANGDVRPCFFHQPIGNLHSQLPLDAILNGPEALAFRKGLDVSANPICQRCVCSLHWKGA